MPTEHQNGNGIAPIFENLAEADILLLDGVRVEVGDVMPMGDEIWVGIGDAEDFDKFKTARTNEAAVIWLKEFPSKITHYDHLLFKIGYRSHQGQRFT